jgi:hypothetical protein
MKCHWPEPTHVEYPEKDLETPRILILEEEDSTLGARLSLDLTPAFKVLSYSRPYSLVSRLDRAMDMGERIHGVIVSQSLTRDAFMHFLSYMTSTPKYYSIILYYFQDRIFYGFREGRRLFARPCMRMDDLRLQIDAILDCNNPAGAGRAAQALA